MSDSCFLHPRRNAKHEYEFVFTTSLIRQFLKVYSDMDYWSLFATPPQGCHIRLVRAARTEKWTEDIVERIGILVENNPVQLSDRVVPNSGHWLQVDNPVGLHEAIRDLLSSVCSTFSHCVLLSVLHSCCCLLFILSPCVAICSSISELSISMNNEQSAIHLLQRTEKETAFSNAITTKHNSLPTHGATRLHRTHSIVASQLSY